MYMILLCFRPLGQMLRPLIDTMSVQPSGGHAVFNQQQLQQQSMNSGPESTNEPKTQISPAQQQQVPVPHATAGNSLPGSSNSSRSDTSNFDPSLEEEEMYDPFVYNEVITLFLDFLVEDKLYFGEHWTHLTD